MKRAFLTGATGFVGANLARALLEKGVAVRALVRPGADLRSLQGLDVEMCPGDLADAAALRRHLAGCDACFHLAAAYRASDPAELYRTNRDGTRAVLEAAAGAGAGAIVHVSTIGTLSRPEGGGLLRESDTRLPEGASDYVKSKFEGEAIAAELAARGAPVMIAHPAAPVGPWDRVPTVTGERIIQVLRGKEPRYGVAAVINHVPVRDVALGAILAAERGSPGRHYLLASANGNLSEKDLVDLVTLAAGLGPRRPRGRLRRWFGRRGRTGRGAGAPATLACDPSGSVQELGLPQSPLAEAFREAVEWFRRHGYVS